MTSQLVKKNIDQYIQGLSLELQSIIFYFIPPMGTAKVIKNVIDIYQKDRKYTKRYNMYYIKNTLSFINYVYDSNYNPDDYEYGPITYNEGKLLQLNYINNEDEYDEYDEYEHEEDDEFAIQQKKYILNLCVKNSHLYI
jgi:hypothetical protein